MIVEWSVHTYDSMIKIICLMLYLFINTLHFICCNEGRDCYMKYRSRTDIVGLVLDAANGGGATKTRIMYKAFLSFAQLKEYLTVLLENDLVEYEEGRQFFRTTEKGIRFLQMYNQFDEMMSINGVRK